MADSTLTIVVSAVLIVLPLLWGVWRWARRHSARSLIRSIGLALIPAGLWILGVMSMVTQWLRQFVDWVRKTHMGTAQWIGAGAAVVGLLAILGGSFITPITRQQARDRRAASAGRPDPAGTGSDSTRKQVPATGRAKGSPTVGQNADRAGFTDEDRELMKLLKDRGID